MADTCTQIYLHIVISVGDRKPSLKKAWRADLFNYISGVIRNRQHKVIAINGSDDHVHIFIRYVPIERLGDLVAAIKSTATIWLRQKRYVRPDFNWQPGYTAFSHSQSQVGGLIRYIDRQEQHHRRRTFRDEHIDLLKHSGYAVSDIYEYH